LLAYWISTAVADFALASILISAIVTTVLVAGASGSTAAATHAMRSWPSL